ncbi:MAG TPA: hypothetical protein VGE26_10290 [Sphingobacteriaceae bacterium]
MKQLIRSFFVFLAFQLFYYSADGQIIVNGHNPKRDFFAGPQQSLSISYGSILWIDGKNIPLAGYSEPLADFHGIGDLFSVEKYNFSIGVNVGYERNLSDLVSVRGAFSTGKLFTGIGGRLDLITHDKSSISQLGLYTRFSLTKNLKRRLQFQWLVGPELLYAKKDVLVEEYVADETSTPDNYRQNIKVVEGALVTGLGISLRLTKKFSLFSDGMVGIAMPGNGLKLTNSGIGMKYHW